MIRPKCISIVKVVVYLRVLKLKKIPPTNCKHKVLLIILVIIFEQRKIFCLGFFFLFFFFNIVMFTDMVLPFICIKNSITNKTKTCVLPSTEIFI